jgi:hypothetical protein
VAALEISDDKLTATVNAGLKGRAGVTVTVNGELTQTCKIVVSDSRLKDISLSPRSIALDLNSRAREYVNLTTIPYNADAGGLIWSSSDSGIAEVVPTSDGRRAQVVGKEAGSAFITVTSPDGKLTARCDVKVTGQKLSETPNADAPAGASPETPNANAPAGASPEVPGADATGKTSSVKTAKPVMKKVTGLTVKKNGKRAARLRWNKVDGARGYTIYQKKGKGSWKKVGDVKKRSYVKKGLDAKAKYQYRVRAWRSKDGKRIYGAYSKSVKR